MGSTEKPRRTLSNHRHAAPSAPWPWLDITEEIQVSDDLPKKHHCPHKPGQCVDCWKKYPQSHFPNWTPAQVERSGLEYQDPSSRSQTEHRLHYVDVANDGSFSRSRRQPDGANEETFWKVLRDGKRAENTRVRAIFIDDPSKSVLKMIGQKYEVEPFFWTSTINWIPARYQEDPQPGIGDHITITLAFPSPNKLNTSTSSYPPHSASDGDSSQTLTDDSEIDTQSPLYTHDHSLILDLIGVHMIRDVQSSTIIFYQPPSEHHVTLASSIHTRVFLAGQGVYWGNIFKASSDPTFVLLIMLWYALFAWDESLEILWKYITLLELQVFKVKDNDIRFTRQLYRIRAYLLHYASLLEDFKKTVEFISNTRNPAMGASIYADNRDFSRDTLERECNILLSQIERLSSSRDLWDHRLRNIMQLAFSSINIQDSAQMKTLTKAALRDSAAMKQIAYLTMVFLPASFVATAFGMNIKEIVNDDRTRGTLAHYVETAIPFTIATMWIVIALQGDWKYDDKEAGIMSRLSWPMLLAKATWRREGTNSDKGKSAV